MSKKLVNEGQNLFDVTLQNYGSLDAIFDLMGDNGFDINTDLRGGLVVTIDDSKVADRIYVNQLERSGVSVGGGDPIVDPLLETALQDDYSVFITDDNNNRVTID